MPEPIAPFFSIETTLDCNLDCVMCNSPRESKRNPLTPSQIKQILRDVAPLVPEVTFTGGEPTIDPFLSEYLECLPESIPVTILTNGTTLGDRFLRERILPRVYELRVSIDDMVDQTSSVQRIGSNPKEIFENLIAVRKEFPSLVIVITTVLNAALLGRIEEFYDRVTAPDVAINALRLIPQIYYRGRAPEAIARGKWGIVDFPTVGRATQSLIQKYLKRKRDFVLDIQHLFCSVTLDPDYVIETFEDHRSPCQYQDALYVNNQGDLILCPNASYRLATISEFGKVDDFIRQRLEPEVVESHPFRKLKVIDKPQCLLCRYRLLCGSSCPATSEAICGDTTLPDPIACSFSNIWERAILPVLPEYLQEKFRAVLNHEGTYPQEFRNIMEVLERYR